nr:putative ribonuclease h protein [Quercus suber]
MVLRQVKWEKPGVGWLKLNTDGSCNAALGKAAGGGLVRDNLGNWVVGFARKLGNVNSFTAEIWALRDGLMVCRQMNLPAIIIEIDAKALADALRNPKYSNSVISPLFDDCKYLISQLPHVRINHIFREANKCADRLANSGYTQDLEFIMHSVPPVDLVSFVEADYHGVPCNRLGPELVPSF